MFKISYFSLIIVLLFKLHSLIPYSSFLRLEPSFLLELNSYYSIHKVINERIQRKWFAYVTLKGMLQFFVGCAISQSYFVMISHQDTQSSLSHKTKYNNWNSHRDFPQSFSESLSLSNLKFLHQMFSISNQETNRSDNNKSTIKPQDSNENKEDAVVAFANTVADPGTVVIHGLYTRVTDCTVNGTHWTVDQTCLAKFQFDCCNILSLYSA